MATLTAEYDVETSAEPWAAHNASIDHEVETSAEPWAAHNASSHIPRPWLQKVIEDAEKGIGISRPYATGHEAFLAMMKEADELDDDEDIYADDYYDRLDAKILCMQP